ncbi:RNA ligase/cyclic nucleotide phosphodiesterase [Mycena latifolia]|nr:RNA ligase/cyclic nucleotide phosphodiesterase [Mycena latifolia]
MSGEGISTSNPFDALLEESRNDPRYEAHRTTRNAEQKAIFISPEFKGLLIDPILLRLEDPSVEPGFVDTRNSMNFIARPPAKVKALIRECQERLLDVVPNIWTVPETALHITALEVAHSRTADEIAALVPKLRATARAIMNHPLTHRTRLVRPVLSFDTSALALSFLPAPGSDGYTYHHLRRDLFDAARAAGAELHSQYFVPSAHVTIGRFIRVEDVCTEGNVDPEMVRRLVERIDELNAWLAHEVWPTDGGEWDVGEETGLEWRIGLVWYGCGGETLMVGRVEDAR